MRPRCLCRGNQVARPLAADASISGRGGRDPGPIELAWKIGELMDDDRRLRGADRSGQRRRVENVDHGRHNPCPLQHHCRLRMTRRAGDLLLGVQQERHQSAADGARRARKEYSHSLMLRPRTALGRDRRGKAQMARLKPLHRDFFVRSVHAVAPDLIGVTLLFKGVGGVIVEVEAYHHTDPAAHSFGGRTERNSVMFGPPGYAYVYRSYGIHWCLNFVCEPEGSASAVLIRAIEPLEGLAKMRRRRGLADERLLCSGPGRLAQAMAVTHAHNGLALDRLPFELY